MTIDDVKERMSRLLGMPVEASGRYVLRVVADNGKIADWSMIPKDFDYTDDELIQKFVNPIRSVLV